MSGPVKCRYDGKGIAVDTVAADLTVHEQAVGVGCSSAPPRTPRGRP
jgi:hypothetical protein